MSLLIAISGLCISAYITFRYAIRDRVLSLIFLFSAVHALYVFPKILALTLSTAPLAIAFQQQNYDLTAAFMAFSCYLATVLTYKALKRHESRQATLDLTPETESRLLLFSIVFGLIGVSAFAGLAMTNGGHFLFYFGGYRYRLELLNANVWLIFFSRFIYPALAVSALLTVWRTTPKRLLLTVSLAIYPLMNVFVLFRRSDLLFLFFIMLCVIVYMHKWRLNRPAIILSGLLTALAIISFPYLRQEQMPQIYGYYIEKKQEANLTDFVARFFEVRYENEIVRAVTVMRNVDETGGFEYGTFIWNSLIQQFVPSSLVGRDVKDSLLLDISERNRFTWYDRKFQMYDHVAPMGFAEAYKQFGYFGWIVFVVIAAVVVRVESAANKWSNRIFLIILIPLVALTATNDIITFPAKFLTFWIVTRFIGRWRFNLVKMPRWHDGINLR